MLRILGEGQGAGFDRREILRVGGLSLFGGLSMPGLLRAVERDPGRPRRARSVILFNLLGGPSHMDMFDLKPEAPVEVRASSSPSPLP